MKISGIIGLAAMLTLSSCGGGGSSNSGSFDSDSNLGTYEGGGDALFKFENETVNDFVPATVIIRANNQVQASDGVAGNETVGTLAGDSFETAGVFTFAKAGLNCKMAIKYTGSISIELNTPTVTGTLFGSGLCDQMPSTISGSFIARKISDAQ